MSKGRGAQINPTSFIGKTIVSLDVSAVNLIKFSFTDGTTSELETVPVGYGIYSIEEVGTILPDER